MISKRVILLAAVSIMAMVPSRADAYDRGAWVLDLNGASLHSEDGYGGFYRVDDRVRYFAPRGYNEFNPGLGVSYAAKDWLDIKAGFFENSYYDWSAYAAGFLHKDYYFGDMAVAPGLLVALMTGYDDTPEDAPAVVPLPLPAVSLGTRDARLNIGYSPWGAVQFFTFQAQFRFDTWFRRDDREELRDRMAPLDR